METATQEIARFEVQPHYSVESSRLIERLRQGQVGDVLTDEELTKECGKNTATGGPGYSYLQTAIKWCERNGIVWRRIREAGCIKCLTSSELINAGRSDMKRTHRANKRIARRLGAAKTDELDNGERIAHSAMMAQTMTLVAFSAQKTTKKLEARNASKPVDMERLLENWD